MRADLGTHLPRTPPEEVGRVRRWTRDVLHDSPHPDDAAPIVSELGSNALVHSASGNPSGSFHVSLHRTPGSVVLAVTDTAEARPSPTSRHRTRTTPTGAAWAWSQRWPTAYR
ncbi:ATP-binding protein [Streptomyces sp. enrichment culture]|uniref:ATP-binding protein n=1 Tax=Streptomyces sp. enrichment culture TaxID=1795815 RepID=UPI003F54FAF6